MSQQSLKSALQKKSVWPLSSIALDKVPSFFPFFISGIFLIRLGHFFLSAAFEICLRWLRTDMSVRIPHSPCAKLERKPRNLVTTS